ncbi:hypothetical protein LSPCS325_05540 [Lysinibacillus sp. CTST325]
MGLIGRPQEALRESEASATKRPAGTKSTPLYSDEPYFIGFMQIKSALTFE